MIKVLLDVLFNGSRLFSKNSIRPTKSLLPSRELLAESLAYFTRNELDVLQLVNRSFDAFIATAYADYPIRTMYAVVVGNDSEVLVHRVEGSKKREDRLRYATFEEFMTLQKRQPVDFYQIVIQKRGENEGKDQRILQEISDEAYHWGAKWFACRVIDESFPPNHLLVKKYNPKAGGWMPTYLYGRMSFHLFHATHLEAVLPTGGHYRAKTPMAWMKYLAKTSIPGDGYFFSVKELITWMEYPAKAQCGKGNRGRTRKTFACNTYPHPANLVNQLIKRFLGAVEPCPYEIRIQMVDKLDEGVDSVEKAASSGPSFNHTTGEIMELEITPYLASANRNASNGAVGAEDSNCEGTKLLVVLRRQPIRAFNPLNPWDKKEIMCDEKVNVDASKSPINFGEWFQVFDKDYKHLGEFRFC